MAKEKSYNKVVNKKRPLLLVVSLAWELGYTIAIPLVVFALAGRWADTAFGTSPWLLLGGIVLSLAVTSYLIYKKVAKILSQNYSTQNNTDKNTVSKTQNDSEQ